MRPQNKKKETKPRKTARTKARRAKLTPLQQMREEKKRLLAINGLLAQQMLQIKAENAKTIASIEKDAISKIKLLKAGLILSLAVNIICIVILLYLINY